MKNEISMLREGWKRNEVFVEPFRDSRLVEYKQPIEEFQPIVVGDKIEMKRVRIGEEVVQFEEDRIRNVDIPDNRAFIDMGLSISKNPWVDNEGGRCDYSRGKVRHMDSADFRERCVVMNGRLYALYLKGKNDFLPPRHLRQEVIFDQIPSATREMSDRLTRFFRKIDAKKDVVKGLIKGYYNMPEGFNIWEKSELEEQIGDFENIEMTLERISLENENNERSLEDERLFYYEVSNKMIESGNCTQFSSVLQQINYIEREARRAYKNWLRDGEPDLDMLATQTETEIDDMMNEEEEYVDPKEEPIINSGEFGAFPLYFEDDGLDIEYINDIKEASVKDLKEIQKDMFPVYNDYTGKYSKPVLHYLTETQKSVFWSFISWRKQQLIDQIKKTAQEHILRIIEFILKNGKTTGVRGLILAMGRGEPFSIDKQIFEGKPTDDEYWLMWEAYKEAGNKKKKFKF